MGSRERRFTEFTSAFPNFFSVIDSLADFLTVRIDR